MELGVSGAWLYGCCDRLCGFGDAQACKCAEMTASALIHELHAGDCVGDGVVYDEAAHGYDAVQGQVQGLWLSGDGEPSIVQERLGVSVCVAELYLGGIGHRGIAVAAVCEYHYLICSGVELDIGRAVMVVA